MNTRPAQPTPTQAEQLADLYRAQDDAALRAQIHLQELPGGPF